MDDGISINEKLNQKTAGVKMLSYLLKYKSPACECFCAITKGMSMEYY